MKKIVALVLAALMVLSMTSAFAADVNLTAFQYVLENQNTDFNDMWYFKQIEEQTGVHVDFNQIKDANWSTQLNLMFASQDMDDMIIRNPVDVEDYGVSQGLLMALDEYLTEDIMPNYVPRLALNNSGDSIPASDGKTYNIGYLIAQNVNHTGTWYVNVDKLAELNLEVPTTIDEFTNVLRAFKAAGIEYPFSSSFTDFGPETLWNQFASFGVPENVYWVAIDENDKVQFTGAMDGWKDCVAWMHTLYEEGLMDPECLTQDSNLWANKVNAGQVGAFCYLRLINTALTPETYAHFKSILPPVAEGHKAAVSSILEIPDAGAYLTITNPDPVATLKWLDAQMETENMMVAANGKVGEQIVLNDAGKYEVINIPENNGLYGFVPVTMGQFFAPGAYYTEIYQMAPHRVERYEDSVAYAEAGVLEAKSFNYLTKLSKMDNDTAVEAANIKTELDKFMKESVVEFVKNGITDAQYEQFVKTANQIGADRYAAMYQAAYDAYLAK